MAQIDLSCYASSPAHASEGVTVILPLRGINRLQAIKTCIYYIRLQHVTPLEIISVEEDETKLLDIPSDKHLFLHSTDQFNKSKCINCGVASATYDNICIHDADMIMSMGYIKRICDILNDHDAGNIIKDIFYLKNVPDDNIIDTSYINRWEGNAGFNCHGGSLFFKKQSFIRCGGMDESFVGNGSEDSEFYFRIKESCRFYDTREVTLLHMPHSRNDSNVERNLKIWNTAKRIPKEQRLQTLQSQLFQAWGLK